MIGRTILLVEDNAWDARLLREALLQARRPPRVDVARDGEEALAYLRHEGAHAREPRPDLVLLDLNLPRRDGREVLADIKADPDLRRIPVIVLTSSTAEQDVVRAYNLHANAYLRKPVDPDEYLTLTHAIEEFWFRCTIPAPH